jgi:hypothetical protein
MQRYTCNYRCSSEKKRYFFYPRTTLLVLCFSVLILSFAPTSSLVFSKTPMYVPSQPTGTTFGFVGISYTYVIVTVNPDSFWMFDWGDGTNTSWLQLEKDHTSISQTHVWNAPGTYQLHVKFKSDIVPYGIWSEAMFVEIVAYSTEDSPLKPIINTGKTLGVFNKTYVYSAVTTDSNDYPVRYRFDYGNGVLSTWTEFIPSGSNGYLSYGWNKPGVYLLRVQAINQYGLESDWSDPVQVIMKNTSEDNGESTDLVMLNNVHYEILYTSPYEGTFYNPASGVSTDIQWTDNGMFLIDDDGDGRWEFFYIPTQGLIQPYVEQTWLQKDTLSGIPWLLIIIILTVVLCVIGSIVILIKKGYIYFYEEDV